MGSVVQEFMFDTFSNEQEVETALITAEHVLLLNTHTGRQVRNSSVGHSATDLWMLKNHVSSVEPSLKDHILGGTSVLGQRSHVVPDVYLVSGEVLLVAAAAVQNSQTVLTQKVFGVSMTQFEMRPQV